MQDRCSERLKELTIEPEVFQNMDDFKLPTEYGTFGMSVRIQFPKFSRGFSCSDFKTFIHDEVGEEFVISLGRLAFPNEWQMQVSTSEVREKLIRMERTKINMRTCWISPLNQTEVRGNIHWLPCEIPDDHVMNILKACGDVLFIERSNNTKFTLKYRSDKRYFAISLKCGQTMDDIPHFITVDNYQGFVSIRGRAPICFHCRMVGHRKSECKTYHIKLNGYCARRPGRQRKERPRGHRHKNAARIEAQEHTIAAVTKLTMPEADYKVEEDKADSQPSVLEVDADSLPSVLEVDADSLPSVLEVDADSLPSVLEVDADSLPSVLEVDADSLPSVLEVDADSIQSVPEADNRVKEADLNVTEPFLEGCDIGSVLPCETVHSPNPVAHLHELEKDIVETLTNTADALNDKIQVATRYLCGELKTKKKKKSKPKKKQV